MRRGGWFPASRCAWAVASSSSCRGPWRRHAREADRGTPEAEAAALRARRAVQLLEHLRRLLEHLELLALRRRGGDNPTVITSSCVSSSSWALSSSPRWRRSSGTRHSRRGSPGTALGPPDRLRRHCGTVRQKDPDFSLVLFEDFAYALYARAHGARHSDTARPAVSLPHGGCADTLLGRRPVGAPVRAAVVGSMRIVPRRHPGREGGARLRGQPRRGRLRRRGHAVRPGALVLSAGPPAPGRAPGRACAPSDVRPAGRRSRRAARTSAPPAARGWTTAGSTGRSRRSPSRRWKSGPRR